MYIYIGHYKIPIVKEELPKISKYKVFVDLDMSNSFHRLKLGPITSSRLSIQTPWGQVEPKLMPDERTLSRWSDDTVFPIIIFLINSHVSSETGMEPFRLRFGDRDQIFMQLPETNSIFDNACEFVRQLNENLSTVRETSRKYQQEVLNENSRMSLLRNNRTGISQEIMCYIIGAQQCTTETLTVPLRSLHVGT